MRPTRLLILAASTAASIAGLPAHAAGVLVPHRAVYDLNLADASDRSGITGISGRMVYEFNGSRCEGYSVKFRFVTQIDTSEQSRTTDQQTATYEDGKGETFNFVTKSFVDNALDKEVKGTASLGGGSTEVKLDKPKAESLKLDATQFPTRHLMQLIDNAKKGETFYEATIFDGSEDANEVLTTTVIIGREEETAPTDPEFSALKKPEKFWPVSIAYFDGKDQDGEEVPIYNIAFKLQEDGITRGLVMDYGDFSMTGKLVDLSYFPPVKDSCE